MEEILKENKKLKERVEELEELLRRKSGSNSRAYDEIRAMIISKVSKEVDVSKVREEWARKSTLQKAERQIMSDLKWDLRVRRIQDFRNEHIQAAKEYIEKYILPEELKKSRWEEIII